MAQTKLGSDGLSLLSLLSIVGNDQGSLLLDHFYSFGSPNYALMLDGDTGKPGGYLTQYVTSGGFHLAQGGTYYGGGPWKTDANSTSFAAVSGADGVLYFHSNSGLAANTQFTPNMRMCIDSVGSVGIGAFAKGAATGFNFLELSSASWMAQSANGNSYYGKNWYYNGAYKYKTANRALLYVQDDSGHSWHIAPVGSVDGTITFTQAMTLDPSGNLLVGVTSAGCSTIAKNVTKDAGTGLLLVQHSDTSYCAGFAAVAGGAGVYNSAAAAMYLSKAVTTSRSINAGGTVNASGADYAEYMTKADGVGAIEKGAIVGIDVDGRLTDQYAAAVSFLIKSTDPSYVGGDVWGNEASIGMAKPIEPALNLPAYAGAADPGGAPTEPQAPPPPQLTPMPTEPIKPGPGASEMDWVNYLPALEEYQQLSQAVANHNQELQDAYNAMLEVYQQQLEQYQAIKASYDDALAIYNSDQAAYREQVDAVRLQFDSVTMPAYQADQAKFNALLEAARERVDRIAYCGQVPVNVQGGVPGQYVVPIADGDGIAGQLVDAAAVTFDQYRRAVGIVQNILPDGRANVRVKPV